MSAYVISEVEFMDAAATDKYRTLAAAAIAKYGGKYLVRGATPTVAEGETNDRLFVIVEFASMVVIQEWYNSEDYAKALVYKEQALKRRLVFAEGVAKIEPESTDG
ncbi:DUF1330 domain-containing protein [Mucilaginibacter sp. HD30]